MTMDEFKHIFFWEVMKLALLLMVGRSGALGQIGPNKLTATAVAPWCKLNSRDTCIFGYASGGAP